MATTTKHNLNKMGAISVLYIVACFVACSTFAASGVSGPAGVQKGSLAQAIDLSLKGKNKEAEKMLLGLQAPVSSGNRANQDQISLALGRVRFAENDFKGAIEAYQGVQRGSDEWFLALEEKAWAYYRTGELDQAIAQLKTLLLPIFKERISLEAYMLKALIDLRICDYKDLFKTLKTFKDNNRDRIKAWETTPEEPHAKSQLAEASRVIQKLSVIESEGIQRIYMVSEIKGHEGMKHANTKKSGDLSFPYDPGGEVWMDEVDHFKVDFKGCPKTSDLGKVSRI